jgi:hypothetical protein
MVVAKHRQLQLAIFGSLIDLNIPRMPLTVEPRNINWMDAQNKTPI